MWRCGKGLLVAHQLEEPPAITAPAPPHVVARQLKINGLRIRSRRVRVDVAIGKPWESAGLMGYMEFNDVSMMVQCWFNGGSVVA